MKDNHPIDNMFRDGLASRKLTPPASAWDAIEANVQDKRSNKGLFFYLAIAASASLVCAFTWSSMNTNQKSTSTLQVATIQKQLPSVDIKASLVNNITPIAAPNNPAGVVPLLQESFEEPIDLTTPTTSNTLVVDVYTVNKIQPNSGLYNQRSVIKSDITLNVSAFVAAPEIVEESRGFKFNFIRGLASVAKSVDDGKKAIGSMRKSKIEFVNEGLRYGKSEESQKTQATIDEDSPSNEK